MKLTMYNDSMPDWLKRNININCPYCGAPIVDDGPSGKLTQRYCPNVKCCGHMSFRVEALAKRFNVSDVGPKTALSIIKNNNLENHLDALKIWFGDVKPKVHLWEVGDLAMVYGYSNEWKEMTRGMASMEEYFREAIIIPPEIYRNKEYLIYCQSYFDIKPPLSKKIMNVMITGSIPGFSNRRMFVETINQKFGKVIQTVDVGKRVSGVDYLIKEPGTEDHSKTDLAIQHDIPIISPIEYVEKIASLVTYISDEKKNT